MRRILLVLPFFLLGCDALVPAFNADADRRVVDAYQQISEILAKADLGALTSKSSYQGELDTYASIISKLETAKLSIQGSGPTGNSPAASNNALLVSIINGCLSNVKTLSQMHQQFGIQPNVGATQPIRTACDQAVKAVGARGPSIGG